MGNLKAFRGGCIICMDYSNHSVNFNYFHLVSQFKDIKKVLVDRLRLMDGDGFNFDNGFMFGFSFGGHVALESAIELGEQRFRMIDSTFENLKSKNNFFLFYFFFLSL